MSRLITYRGKAWTAEISSSTIRDGATRTNVKFTRADTGDTAEGWVHGSSRDFDGLPADTLVDALVAALGPKRIQPD